MKSITVHDLDDNLARAISREAHENGESLNRTIKKLLRTALGLNAARENSPFARFCGGWSEKEFRDFQAKIAEADKINPADWR